MEDLKNKSGASPDQEPNAQDEEVIEEQPSPDASQEQSQSKESEDKVESEDSKDIIDYQAELEEKEKRLKQAEHTIVELKRDKKKDKEVDEPVKEDTSEIISQEVQKQVAVARQELVQDTIDDIIEQSSVNPDERKLIKWHYLNSIRPTGFTRQAILEDIENAKMFANKKRVFKENSELKIALKNKNSMSNISLGTNQDRKEPDNTNNKFSSRELEVLARRAKGDPKKLKELKEKALANMRKTK